MNISNIKIVTLIALFGTNLHAAENDTEQSFTLLGNQSNNLNSLNVNNEWISANHKDNTPVFTLKANKNTDFGNEVAFAWNLSDSIVINLNLFESQLNLNTTSRHNAIPQNYNKNLNKNPSKNFGKPTTPYQTPSFDTNSNISGYNFGISSKFGMGNNTVLNIDFNYGQLVDVNSAEFTNPDVNTSSFALGFRKAKFGASFQTDSFLENNIDVIDNTRLGIELDWYFSDDTTISFGSKQRINSKQANGPNSLDSLTGDVQYIKFQHNL
ncbi:MAG: hypothetical protein L3J83_12195 [Proteobacteria bacterium]|nr:hypothetical protein [Pseudomonadota bacterium]